MDEKREQVARERESLAGLWDDDLFVQVMKLNERIGQLLGDIAASGHAPGDPQASAVSAERVVELERQLAAAILDRDQRTGELQELHNLLATAYVVREVPWSDVAAGMMTIARDGTPWMVAVRHDDGRAELRNGDQIFTKNPTRGETVRVLVPYVTPEQAEGLVRDGLGAVRT